jgi:hypothetical protein
MNGNHAPRLNCAASLEDVNASDTMAFLHRECRKSTPEQFPGSDISHFAKVHQLEVIDGRIQGAKGFISAHRRYGIILTLPSKYATKAMMGLGTLVEVTGAHASVQFDKRNARRVIAAAGLHVKELSEKQQTSLAAGRAKSPVFAAKGLTLRSCEKPMETAFLSPLESGAPQTQFFGSDPA